MKYENLDSDTRSIIDAMCFHTGKTKEQAILGLIEFGMAAMMAAIHQQGDNKILKKAFDAVSKDAKLIATAEAYRRSWDVYRTDDLFFG